MKKRMRKFRVGAALCGLAIAAVTALLTEALRNPYANIGFPEEEAAPPAGESRSPAALAPTQGPIRLLLFTLDGVRPDEFFDCMEIPIINPNPDPKTCSFPHLWRGVDSKEFEVSGMRVGNSKNLSLPGYQTIYTGATQVATCPNNDEDECQLPPVRTWLEELVLAFGLRWYEVSVIASWRKMVLGVQSQPGRIHVNAGVLDMDDPRDGANGVPAPLATANYRQSRQLPEWADARKDEYTAEFAKWYFFTVEPRIQVVSFLDSDEHGHADEFSKYRKSLRWYDAKIQEFREELRRRNQLQNTMIMITTDHGRGRGGFGYAFQGHGPEWYLDHSANAWFAISVPPALRAAWQLKKKALERRQFTQRDIKSIVKTLMTGQ